MARMVAMLGLLVVAAGEAAAESVDLELVLLADASRSIDDGEIRLQREGYAAAITHPEVLRAIEQGFDQRIAVTYVEWGDARSQDVVVPWTVIDGKDSAAAFAETLMAQPRRAFGPNAIGSALTVAQALIESNQYDGYRKVIDLSADSASSWDGISLAEARQNALTADIVINGLAVLCRSCSGRPNTYDLEAAFAERIIGGPASFVVTAEKDDQFAEAVRRKLLLEIAGVTPSVRQSPEPLSRVPQSHLALRVRLTLNWQICQSRQHDASHLLGWEFAEGSAEVPRGGPGTDHFRP